MHANLQQWREHLQRELIKQIEIVRWGLWRYQRNWKRSRKIQGSLGRVANSSRNTLSVLNHRRSQIQGDWLREKKHHFDHSRHQFCRLPWFGFHSNLHRRCPQSFEKRPDNISGLGNGEPIQGKRKALWEESPAEKFGQHNKAESGREFPRWLIGHNSLFPRTILILMI